MSFFMRESPVGLGINGHSAGLFWLLQGQRDGRADQLEGVALAGPGIALGSAGMGISVLVPERRIWSRVRVARWASGPLGAHRVPARARPRRNARIYTPPTEDDVQAAVDSITVNY
jgi:hypothetical protein